MKKNKIDISDIVKKSNPKDYGFENEKEVDRYINFLKENGIDVKQELNDINFKRNGDNDYSAFNAIIILLIFLGLPIFSIIYAIFQYQIVIWIECILSIYIIKYFHYLGLKKRKLRKTIKFDNLKRYINSMEKYNFFNSNDVNKYIKEINNRINTTPAAKNYLEYTGSQDDIKWVFLIKDYYFGNDKKGLIIEIIEKLLIPNLYYSSNKPFIDIALSLNFIKSYCSIPYEIITDEDIKKISKYTIENYDFGNDAVGYVQLQNIITDGNFNSEEFFDKIKKSKKEIYHDKK